MFQLGIDSIRERSTNGPTYMKGRAYYRDGHLQSFSFDQEKGLIQAQVVGTRIYQVRVILTRAGDLHDATCTCSAFTSYWGFCKHIVAVLLYCVDQYGRAKTHIAPAVKPLDATVGEKGAKAGGAAASPHNLRRSRLKARDFLSRMQRSAELAQTSGKQPVHLRVTLHCSTTAIALPYLSFAIGTDHLFPVTNAEQFAEAITRDQSLELDQRFTWNPLEHVFAAADQPLVQMIQEAYESDYKTVFGAAHTASHDRFLMLNATRFARFLEMAPSLCDVSWRSLRDEATSPIKVKNEPLPLSLKLEQAQSEGDDAAAGPDAASAAGSAAGLPARTEDERFRVTLVTGQPLIQMTASRNVYLYGDTFYLPPRDTIRLIEPILSVLAGSEPHSLTISRDELLALMSEIRPLLAGICPIVPEQRLSERLLIAPLETRVALDWHDDMIRADIRYHYGDAAFAPFLSGGQTAAPASRTAQAAGSVAAATAVDRSGAHSAGKSAVPAEGMAAPVSADRLVVRDLHRENAFINRLKSLGFQRHGASMRLSDPDLSYSFLSGGLDALRKEATLTMSPAMARLKVLPPPRIGYTVRLDPQRQALAVLGDWSGMGRNTVGAYIRALREKRPYLRLSDGSFQMVDPCERDMVVAMSDALELFGGNPAAAENVLPQYRALALASVVNAHGDRIVADDAYRLLVERITDTDSMKTRLPAPLGTLMRPYQKNGFQWLVALDHFGLGGILADDMGLGKTLQTLAYVVHTYRQKKLPTLIVAPTSLVYNWQSEAGKFVPRLPVLVIDGLRNVRNDLWASVGSQALVITSYSLLRRDIDLIAEQTFASCFIDEAQNIKNPDTLNARSVKQVRAGRYFALTGTPIENSLTELWSLFDFILPGYLFSRSRFQTLYEWPIQREGSREAVEALHRQIAPFILRRMKSDVLRELPDKIETETVCDMTDEQRALYDRYLRDARHAFETEVSDHGLARSQIFILTLLTRLRQVCCHPTLCQPEYAGGSGKLQLLEELLEDSFASGHRVLVFSAFTSMLEIIRANQRACGREPFYIDGQVPAEDRLCQVQRFNQGEGELFLISLRSGGTGLNLTGADTVIHYDPWWNPAVEDQATDRAYRIGQENVVQVFKLVTRHSIEEKIYNLQRKKKELMDTVITPGQNFLSQMSLEEIRSLFEG